MFSRAFLITLLTLLSSFVLEAWGAAVMIDASPAYLEKRWCGLWCRIADTGASSSVDFSTTGSLPTLSFIRPVDATTNGDAVSATSTFVRAESTASTAETRATNSPVTDDLSTEAAPSPSSVTGQALPFVYESNSALGMQTLTASSLALSALAGLALFAL